MKRLDEISTELQGKYFRAAERSKSAAQGSADYARRALGNPEKAAEHEKTVAKRTAGISRYTKRYNERNPRPAVKAAPAAVPHKPLGGYDPVSGKSYNESVQNPYDLHEISVDTAKSYLEKSKTAGAKDLAHVARRFAGSLRAQGVVHRDELKKMGDRLAQQRKDLGLAEAKATYCGRCGTTHVAPKFGGTCPALKEGAFSAGQLKPTKEFEKQASKVPSQGTVRGKDDKGVYTAKTVNGKEVSRVYEDVSEEKKGLYYYVNLRKKAGTSRSKDHPDAPTAQDWKNAAKTAKNEDTDMKKLSQIISEAEQKVHPDAIHVKPVNVNGEQKYHVQAVGSNHAEHIKVGEHLSDSELDDFSEMGGRIKHVK